MKKFNFILATLGLTFNGLALFSTSDGMNKGLFLLAAIIATICCCKFAVDQL